MMRVLDMITTAGGASVNVDRVGRSGSLAWVIDGATDLYREAALPAGSDVEWLVDTLGTQLAEAGEAGYQGQGSALLDKMAEHVCQQQAVYGFPVDRLPPACSVAVLVDQGPAYEITRIGDATAVITSGEEAVLATDFFDSRERAAVGHAQGNGSTEEQVRAGMRQRRLQTMTSGDVESVFSGHPQRQLRPHTLRGDWRGVEHVLLCTDGFARVVTDYAIYSGWREIIDDARMHGLAYLEKRIRDVEDDPTSDRLRRFKRSDDIAALLLAPDGNLS
jgi:hypothetical protein